MPIKNAAKNQECEKYAEESFFGCNFADKFIGMPRDK